MLEEANQLYCGLAYCFWLENSDILHFGDFFLKEKNSLGPEVNQTRTIFNIWLNLFWLQSNEIFVCQIEREKWDENTWRPHVDYLRKKQKLLN